jgi:lysophospholipase L1-like esterase
MLESSKWEIRGFASNGRTVLNSGDFPYQKTPEFQEALKFQPDVVIILLGANDSKPQNWAQASQFSADYKDLIGKFKALPGHPHIFICHPVHVSGEGGYGITEAVVEKEIPIIDQVAQDESVGIIDMHAVLMGHDDLLPDHVHPNAAGQNLLARAVYKVLTGTDFTGTAPSPQ